jgi:hypothetical protein
MTSRTSPRLSARARSCGIAAWLVAVTAPAAADPAAAGLELNDRGYFSMPGLDVIVFSDIYPEGHQTGVTVVQHGVRVAANGDLRLEASPGQWSPVPVAGERSVDRRTQTISQTLSYPDPARDRKGFNPISYPDLAFAYHVRVQRLEHNAFRISVDLDAPLPEEWIGRVGFNLELFPGDLFGKAWLMDDEAGVFPPQPNGPVSDVHGDALTEPLAVGRELVVAPNEDRQRLVIESPKAPLELLDGRANHNNGWYIVRTAVPAGATRNAIEWIVTPNVVPGWHYRPVIQVSQVGYTPGQAKRIVIEQDRRDTTQSMVTVYRLTEKGREEVQSARPAVWDGEFLRYTYLVHDFSEVDEPGMYVIGYRSQFSHAFEIAADVFDRHVWQPTLEYFLPVQMCHMRVNEKYRVWHGNDHADDALMAPVDHNHFDGYIQGSSTLTAYEPLQPVPGLNAGGWHDAGDYDLRVESQMGTVWLLAQMIEEFGLDYDATTIDQEHKLVEIHEPDGRSDGLQQIEHGLLSVLGAYRSLGRLYRGIISPQLRQYVLLGDGSVQTDNRVYDASAAARENGPPDDRWVFTEENPDRELEVAAGLAAASRVLRGYDTALAAEALKAAGELFDEAIDRSGDVAARVFVLSELLQATHDADLAERLVALQDDIAANIGDTGWALAKAMPYIEDAAFEAAIEAAVEEYQAGLLEQSRETPYGVPYRPHIWGAGWDIQEFGVRQYFLHKAWPAQVSGDLYVNALNFVLGVHPGENTISFASGVGSKSALVAYGVNRADWSYIPGGVISGTALIRPDLPELKTWPFFWQQTEYVMGGGATNYMFLVLAVDRLHSQ